MSAARKIALLIGLCTLLGCGTEVRFEVALPASVFPMAVVALVDTSDVASVTVVSHTQLFWVSDPVPALEAGPVGEDVSFADFNSAYTLNKLFLPPLLAVTVEEQEALFVQIHTDFCDQLNEDGTRSWTNHRLTGQDFANLE